MTITTERPNRAVMKARSAVAVAVRQGRDEEGPRQVLAYENLRLKLDQTLDTTGLTADQRRVLVEMLSR